MKKIKTQTQNDHLSDSEDEQRYQYSKKSVDIANQTLIQIEKKGLTMNEQLKIMQEVFEILYRQKEKMESIVKNEKLENKTKETQNLINPKSFLDKVYATDLYKKQIVINEVSNKETSLDFVKKIKEQNPKDTSLQELNIIENDYVQKSDKSDKNITDDILDFYKKKYPDGFIIKPTINANSRHIFSVEGNKIFSHNLCKLVSKEEMFKDINEYKLKENEHMIVQELLKDDSKEVPLVPYRFFCADGKVYCCWCCSSNNPVFLNRKGKLISEAKANKKSLKNIGPKGINSSLKNSCFSKDLYDKMVYIAEKLSDSFEHIRVDLFLAKKNGKVQIYFNEFQPSEPYSDERFNQLLNEDLKEQYNKMIPNKLKNTTFLGKVSNLRQDYIKSHENKIEQQNKILLDSAKLPESRIDKQNKIFYKGNEKNKPHENQIVQQNKILLESAKLPENKITRQDTILLDSAKLPENKIEQQNKIFYKGNEKNKPHENQIVQQNVISYKGSATENQAYPKESSKKHERKPFYKRHIEKNQVYPKESSKKHERKPFYKRHIEKNQASPEETFEKSEPIKQPEHVYKQTTIKENQVYPKESSEKHERKQFYKRPIKNKEKYDLDNTCEHVYHMSKYVK